MILSLSYFRIFEMLSLCAYVFLFSVSFTLFVCVLVLLFFLVRLLPAV
jgi:hypothetical protein